MSSLVYSLRGHLRRVEPEKIWSYSITTILVLLIYLLVNQITVDEPRFNVEKFAEIDFTKFQPPKPKTEEVKKKEAPKPQPDVEAPPEMIDFKMLENLAQEIAMAPTNIVVPQTPIIQQQLELPKIQLDMKILNDRLPTIQNQFGDIPIMTANPSTQGNTSLQALSARGNFVVGRPAKKVGPVAVQGKQVVEDVTKPIPVKNRSDAQIKSALNEMFIKLLEWMKANHKELTPALNIFLDVRQDDLTGEFKIVTATGETYDLFIACNEISQNVAILLVAGVDNSAICLKDVGFRQESHYLTKGFAVRDKHTNNVMSVSSREEAPILSETRKFYNIFLAWWETQRM